MIAIKDKIKEWGLLLAIIISCIIILVMILRGIENFKQITLEKKTEEVNYLTHLLVKQEANVFSTLLLHNTKVEELQDVLDDFVKEDIVLNATLYAANGQLLAVSQKKENSAEDSLQKQDVVEPVYYKDNLEGFLRVSLNRAYLPETLRHMNRSFHYLYAQEIILFLVGGMLMMSIYHFLFFRRGRKRLLAKENQGKVNSHSLKKNKLQKKVKKDPIYEYNHKPNKQKRKRAKKSS